jgi:hypothetical protein
MPNYYNPYYYQSQMNPNQAVQQQVPQLQSQIQSGGFVNVRNETEARNYPVALGNSVTFKDENAPYIYTKTMGFSQLDVPRFDKYKLVKEEPTEPSKLLQDETFDHEPISNTIDNIKDEIKAIWNEIEGIKNDRSKSDTSTRRNAKKEKDGDD